MLLKKVSKSSELAHLVNRDLSHQIVISLLSHVMFGQGKDQNKGRIFADA